MASQGGLGPQFSQKWSSGEGYQAPIMPTFSPPCPGPGNVEREGGSEGRAEIRRVRVGAGLGVLCVGLLEGVASQRASEPAWLGPLQGRASGDHRGGIRLLKDSILKATSIS